jgi:DNA repair protein RadC
MNVKLSKEHRIKVSEAKDIALIMRQILLRDNKLSREREHFWVVGLDAGNHILYIELVSLGTMKKTLVEPMEVFSFALQKHSAAIILVHNHPSGTMKASFGDKDITNRLIQVGKIVGLEVLDHIIIDSKKSAYMSFADEGLMDELEMSTDYIPPYKLIEQVKKLASELADRKARIEIAKTMKKKKVEPKVISQFTGLTVKEIGKL